MVIEFNRVIWFWRGPVPRYLVIVPRGQAEVLNAALFHSDLALSK